MDNLALNKNADSSGIVAPFTHARAVDGAITQFSRWLATSTPAWLLVDLGAPYWVNRWVVRQLGLQGWSQSYNMCDYKFQGSLDNSNWFDLDSVTNNSANQTDRQFIGKQARYVRVYVTKGLRNNNAFSSIAEFEAYEAANAPYLSNLVPSTGALSPAFSQKVFAYAVNVGSGVGSIQFTPTTAQGTTKVNGTVVASGQSSQSIPLISGSNPVTVTVTSSDNTMTASYGVNVVRASDVIVAKLSGLTVTGSDSVALTLTPGFGTDTFNYTASVANGISWVKLTPTAGTGTTTIKVNGVTVASGRQSPQINLNTGSNTITVTASGSGYADGAYTITVSRSA